MAFLPRMTSKSVLYKYGHKLYNSVGSFPHHHRPSRRKYLTQSNVRFETLERPASAELSTKEGFHDRSRPQKAKRNSLGVFRRDKMRGNHRKWKQSHYNYNHPCHFWPTRTIEQGVLLLYGMYGTSVDVLFYVSCAAVHLLVVNLCHDLNFSLGKNTTYMNEHPIPSKIYYYESYGRLDPYHTIPSLM